MTSTGILEKNAINPSIERWAAGLIGDLAPANALTIGLTNGSCRANDRRSVDELARTLHAALSERFDSIQPMLVLRLQHNFGDDIGPAANAVEVDAEPSIIGSNLGGWSEVSVPVPAGNLSSRTLEHVPHWISTWKGKFGVILVDLGPMGEAPSRMMGRLCDGCYILLGPGKCGSRDWILRHVAWHQHSGSTICGTLVISHAT